MKKNKLRTLREQKGLTQAELADLTHLSIRTIQRIESGTTIPKGHTLKILSEKLGIAKEELLSSNSHHKNPKPQSDLNLKLINLSALCFIGIPFGNILIPVIIWNRHKEDAMVDAIGRRIINFQILWTLVTCSLLILSPFLQDYFPSDFTLILNVGLLAAFINLCVIIKTAYDINVSPDNILPLKLRLL